MEIKPIRTEEDHIDALKEIERLWGAESGTPEGDRLDILITLVDAWETKHHPIDPPDPIEAIRFRLEQKGLDQKALIGLIGNRSRVYEVMHRQRSLTLAMIRNLNVRLGIPAEILIRSSQLDRRPATPPASVRQRKQA